MQLNQTPDDSLGQYSQNIDKRIKISLFSKPSIIKVCFFFTVISILVGTPSWANAGFFDWLGPDATASEPTTLENNNEVTLNSQNIPLLSLEPSINPDLKNADTSEGAVIVQDDSFIYSDGILDSDIIFEKSSISDQIIIYTVKEGDTLSEIAESFGVSMNTIRWENNISGNTVSIGQKLNILPVTGIKHIVKSGDTISKIADKYEAEMDDILIFNGIAKGDTLKSGDIIFVPNGIIKPATSKSGSSSSSGKVVVSNTKVQSGYYIRPVPGRITSPYGSRKGGFHPGVDLAGVKGVTSVKAAATGVVTRVVSGCREGVKRCGGGYGNYVDIAHPNGTTTRYAHLYRTSVNLGESISQGEQVGILGNTGSSTGPHLHFEIINANGSKMKPPVY